MWNPFKYNVGENPEVAEPAVLPTGMYDVSDEGFAFPAPQFEWSNWEPVFDGEDPQSFYAPGGYLDDTVAATDPSFAPDYAGVSGVSHWENSNVESSENYSSVIPVGGNAGSIDMAQPRDFGGVAGINRMVHLTGPVGGNGTNLSGYIAKLRSPNPGVNGPVTGDANSQLVAVQNASYAQQLSQEAAANALVSAV